METMGGFKLVGIDDIMVDKRYYANSSDREYFVSFLKEVIDKYIPKDEYIDFSEINNKIFNDFDLQFEIDFQVNVFDYLVLNESFITEINGIKTVHKDEIIYQGRNNLQNNIYFITQFNIEKILSKLDDGNYDWGAEIDMIINALNISQDYNYNRISTLYYLGKSFSTIKNWDKAEEYFNWILKEDYPSTAGVSEFYKNIGELYLSIDNKTTAKLWLEKGLEKNPKLSVKRLLKNL